MISKHRIVAMFTVIIPCKGCSKPKQVEHRAGTEHLPSDFAEASSIPELHQFGEQFGGCSTADMSQRANHFMFSE